MRFAFWIFAVSLLAGACGGKVVVDGESGAGGEIGAGGESGAGGSAIVCSDAGPQDLPAAQRQCATASDCLIETVARPYCSLFEVGVTSSELAAFQAYESACDKPTGPAHTCPIFTVMTFTQDGKSTPGNVVDQVQVACQGGVCSTFMP